MVRIYLRKRNIPDVPEAVIQGPIRAIQRAGCP